MLSAERKNALISMEVGTFMRQTGGVKVFSQVRFNAAGSTIVVYKDADDKQAGEKEAGVRKAIETVTGHHFALPAEIRVYCTQSYEAQNRTFHRDALWNQVCWITLGRTAVGGTGVAGVSSMDNPGFTPVSVTCIHEIGHNLHERALGDAFWETGSGLSQKATHAGDVSAYAGNNRKEFVAEVFAGMNVGRKYPKDVMTEYTGYGGPTSDRLPAA